MALIFSFMADREAFTADEDNKLRFWQSLCIEVSDVCRLTCATCPKADR